ncbi:hypothetical protein [Mucilaginibacter glaciei]|uniref:Uncharacterized protein n=1 Tax=Mucilaginibacter glaciei TaxID=2772109 RepID=A0A926S838_9SPHI|nr:hypothetical protein [Mucilaginibacter glaciei]MBD1395366.1 hypothetical protein [Mucilaginibacter glaciei]
MKKKIENILALSIITVSDLDCFDNPERRKLSSAVNKILNKLKGVERDAFLIKIAAVVPPDTRKQLWEENHLNISAAITSYIRDYGVMPAKYLIAQQTGLSRPTVTKHFNEYKTNPEHLAHMEQFKFMAPKVLSSVFRAAVNGDMRAARLYLQMNGGFDQQPANTVVNEQNNYIQINNTILSQENLKQLSAEQLRQIEDIVRK